MIDKEEVIKSLKLKPHPNEGGYFNRTYDSGLSVETLAGKRKLMSSIYYLLTDDRPIGYLHKNKSDIIHYYHMGAPIRYLVINAEGLISEFYLGPNITKGHQLQLLVKGGDWKASRLCYGKYGLISEAVSPGFEYNDSELASVDMLRSLLPGLLTRLQPYIK